MRVFETLLTSIEDDILVVTINRPKALNALNDQVFKDLIDLFHDELPDDISGVIITGAGEKAFVAGADIKEFLELDNDSAERLAQRGHDIFARIEGLHIPTIAAVNGFALGGGCELAMACHMRVASEHAKFGQPEVNLGILPGYAGSQRLPQLIGKGRAFEFLMTGDMISAQDAYRMGLANHVVAPEDLLSTCKKIIHKISKKAPIAIKEVITVVNDHYDKGKDGFKSEVKAFGRLAATEDFKEGASAFIEKRKPNFQNR